MVEDIIEQLKLNQVWKFKTPCFRPNLYYDVIFEDNLESSYSHLRKFIKWVLKDEDDLKPVSRNLHLLVNIFHIIVSDNDNSDEALKT